MNKSKLMVPLITTACALLLPVNPSNAQQAIWNEYRSNQDKHPKLPNCSYAGYRYGQQALPNPTGPIFNVKTYGALGNGTTDDTVAIRNAINAVGSGGGVVYFPNGTYICSGVLFVHKNQTILRGETRANTKIQFTKSLNDGYAINLSSAGLSMWSWAGGLIWFTPQSKNTYRSSTANMNTDWAGGLDTYRAKAEAWNVGSQVTTITSSQVRGDKTFTVSSTAGLSAGQFIFVRVSNPTDNSLLKHLAGDDTWAASYPWASHVRISNSKMPFLDWPVEIKSISGNTVTLVQPLRFDLRTAWAPKVMAMGDTIRESGLENMTVVLARNYDWAFGTHHNKEVGWNGPWFNNALNCFMRAVTVVDPDTAMGVSACKNVTFTDVKLDWSGIAARRDHHHGTTCRVFSQDCLIENFNVSSEPYHGINVEYFSMGNVWSKGTMNFGTFDTHRMEPAENIRTEITINNVGLRGGAGDAGPIMGARFVNWNINVTNNKNDMIGNAEEMPYGALVGVRGCSINSTVHPTYGDSKCHVEATGSIPNPVNVFEAQKSLRLGGTTNPSPTVSITSPANGATFNAPASIAINAAATDTSPGTVSNVQFFAGSTSLGTDTSSPYSITWSNVAAGAYSLTARATDNGGAVTTSGTVNVTVKGTTGGGTTLYRINAGGAAVSPFSADSNFSGGTAASTTATIDLSGVTNPAPAAVYQTERYGNVTYTFGSLTANTAHTVRLHFAETWHNGPGSRKFDVSINGTQVLNDYDVYAAAGAKNKAVITQHTANANASGQIVIQFTTVVNNAKISGIEIIKN